MKSPFLHNHLVNVYFIDKNRYSIIIKTIIKLGNNIHIFRNEVLVMEGLLTVNINELENKIEDLKSYMIDTGLKLGLSNGKTVQISQELDILIVKYQRLTS
jgi:hypothetical protein